jgi:proteasome lid subunit RPN8/RPN11
MWKEALRTPAVEVCGVILDGVHTIPMSNVSPDPDTSYVYNTVDQKFVWTQWAETGKRQPLILYHTHPTGRAYPSATDIEYARNRGVLYMIACLRDKDVKLFEITDGEVTEVGLSIESPEDGWKGHHPIKYTAPTLANLTDSVDAPICICGAGRSEVPGFIGGKVWWARHLQNIGAAQYAINFELHWREALSNEEGTLDLNKVAKAIQERHSL